MASQSEVDPMMIPTSGFLDSTGVCARFVMISEIHPQPKTERRPSGRLDLATSPNSTAFSHPMRIFSAPSVSLRTYSFG
jgi:hypothetical protein